MYIKHDVTGVFCGTYYTSCDVFSVADSESDTSAPALLWFTTAFQRWIQSLSSSDTQFPWIHSLSFSDNQFPRDGVIVLLLQVQLYLLLNPTQF